MKRTPRSILAGVTGAMLAMLGAWCPAQAHEVSLDSGAARAVLVALANPALTPAEAHRTAQMKGNRMMVRKVATYDPAASEQRFEEELLAAARGVKPEGKALFEFEDIQRQRPALLALLDGLERDQAPLLERVKTRINAFSPAGPPLDLHGYLIAGGRATGFTFGGPDFFLNLDDFAGDPGGVEFVLEHELYHAVQSSARLARHGKDFDRDITPVGLSAAQARSFRVESVLYSLLDEGSATFVGDPLAAAGTGGYSKAEGANIRAKLRRMDRLYALLDISLVALTAPDPAPFREVEQAGFNGDQPLYYLGYAMVRALAHRYGDQKVGEIVLGGGCAFARAYQQLAEQEPSIDKLPERSGRIIAQACP